NLNNVIVRRTPLEPSLPTPEPASVKSDGLFALKSVKAARYQLELTGLPGDSYLQAAAFGRMNALEQEIDVLVGSADSLTIQVNPNGGRFDGVVVDTAGRPLVGATGVLVPEIVLRR